ncbi:eukaryotic peptide chain release factor GTP-binding subunit ERF3A-like [Tubulanus polymorphus]|uniref:eukaryotic peptide chain release factor GTP-binding subunit ERF3A-like n=1 Tax=Tubulanus polymorphus TaxID=672921 RepID=UPI003DA6821E
MTRRRPPLDVTSLISTHAVIRASYSSWNCRKFRRIKLTNADKMSQTDNQNNLPDSWDDGEVDDQVKDASQGLSRLNVGAPEFVPSWLAQAPAPAAAAAAPPASVSPVTTDNNTDSRAAGDATIDNAPTNDSSPVEKVEEAEPPPPDDWAAVANGDDEERDQVTEMEVQDDEDDEDDDEEMIPKKVRIPSECEVKKEHVNVVFIGHVDAGKSTIGGHIMYVTGMVDKRTLEKYEREAKEKNRESWYLSWALDTNTEERDKGKTVEVGRAYFETEMKHFTILDAPGHKSFVPNMIGGASQADLAVLVISARKGEFETGFDRGGQTREHAMLAKTAGVKHLIVLINKMDDPTVLWDKKRYDECKDKLIPYLRRHCGFNPKTDIYFMPVSGLTGAFLKDPPPKEECSWFNGPCLIEYLDRLPSMKRRDDGPLRLPLVDRYKDMGTVVLGKVESGSVARGQMLTMMPNRVVVEVLQLWSDEIENEVAYSGENVKVKLKNVEEEDVSSGFVLCDSNNLCTTGKVFDAQVVILEHKSIICAGYSAVMHIHSCAEEVTLKGLLCLLDKKTGDKTKLRPRFVKQDQVAIARFEVNGGMICMETFKDFPQMGRFTLRDEGKTIAIGKVLKVIDKN